MLAKKDDAVLAPPNEVKPVIGTEQKVFRMSEMDEMSQKHFLKAKAPEHTEVFNHECE